MKKFVTADDVIQSFESSFADKCEIPSTLEYMWLKKAVARYSNEIAGVEYDDVSHTFFTPLDDFAVDTMATYMWQMYQEREVSKVNKRVSIIGKDLSWDTANNPKKYSAEELSYISQKASEMTEHQKQSAYG